MQELKRSGPKINIDATYKTNMCDFNLITFVVLDEYAEVSTSGMGYIKQRGYPVVIKVLKSIKDA